MKLIELHEVSMQGLIAQTQLTTKERAGGVRVKLTKQDMKNRRFHFDVSSDGDVYKVTVKMLGRTMGKGDVLVSCTCPAFLYWGSDYWAAKGKYLDLHHTYRRPRSGGREPKERDPNRRRLVCKHIAAVYYDWKDVSLEGPTSSQPKDSGRV